MGMLRCSIRLGGGRIGGEGEEGWQRWGKGIGMKVSFVNRVGTAPTCPCWIREHAILLSKMIMTSWLLPYVYISRDATVSRSS